MGVSFEYQYVPWSTRTCRIVNPLFRALIAVPQVSSCCGHRISCAFSGPTKRLPSPNDLRLLKIQFSSEPKSIVSSFCEKGGLLERRTLFFVPFLCMLARNKTKFMSWRLAPSYFTKKVPDKRYSMMLFGHNRTHTHKVTFWHTQHCLHYQYE